MTVCTLANTTPEDSIHVRDLKQGQIAEIVEWRKASQHVGLIVKRTATDTLESLGGVTSWTSCCAIEGDGYRVRVLPNGTLLRIEENEK